MVLAAAARCPLGQHQRQHEQQRHERDLRRAAEARALQPGRVDAHGERLHAEILHGAQIVEASPSAPAPGRRPAPAAPAAGPRARTRRPTSGPAYAPPPARRPTAARSSRGPRGRRRDRARRTAPGSRRPGCARRETSSPAPCASRTARAARAARGRRNRAAPRSSRRRCRSAPRAAAPAAGRGSRDPGKRYMVTSQAVAVPNDKHSALTPRAAAAVSASARRQHRAQQMRPDASRRARATARRWWRAAAASRPPARRRTRSTPGTCAAGDAMPAAAATGSDTTAAILVIISAATARACGHGTSSDIAPASLAEQPGVVFGQHACTGQRRSDRHHAVLAEGDRHLRAAAGRAVDHQGRAVGFGQRPRQRQADAEAGIAHLARPLADFAALQRQRRLVMPGPVSATAMRSGPPSS